MTETTDQLKRACSRVVLDIDGMLNDLDKAEMTQYWQRRIKEKLLHARNNIIHASHWIRE